jgi:hypothetical protein
LPSRIAPGRRAVSHVWLFCHGRAALPAGARRLADRRPSVRPPPAALIRYHKASSQRAPARRSHTVAGCRRRASSCQPVPRGGFAPLPRSTHPRQTLPVPGSRRLAAQPQQKPHQGGLACHRRRRSRQAEAVAPGTVSNSGHSYPLLSRSWRGWAAKRSDAASGARPGEGCAARSTLTRVARAPRPLPPSAGEVYGQ